MRTGWPLFGAGTPVRAWMTAELSARIKAALGQEVATLVPLSGGSVGDVRRADLADGSRVVVKSGAPGARLDNEGRMLDSLAALSALPAPKVLHAAPGLLIMTWIENDGGTITAAVERDAADSLAALVIDGVAAGAVGLAWGQAWRQRRLAKAAGGLRLEGGLRDLVARIKYRGATR